MERKKYPITPEGYKLFEEVGQGVSASVHRALCVPFNEIVAIKVLDFERNNSDVVNISREAQTMILVDHPNVLKAYCSFVNNHDLWVVMPFMAGGSCLHILKAAYPDGFQEAVIATVLREVLRGLDYLHQLGHIHRDVKAGNILVDGSGAAKLGDFGVSACLFDSGDRQRLRNTFVGTPCWMAPEVMEQLHGYDFKVDIWSFGITALELAHGHAPFSKYPPMKVLLMTLQNAPPGLDYERDRKCSKSFKQMIAMCLVKDPSKRPSAAKLLKHPFFKHARSNDYIARTILEGLPTLGDRIKALKMKEADMLAQKKMPDGEKEEISQNEYKRGISGWNFDIEDMKAQASLIQDVEETPQNKDQGEFSSTLFGLDGSPEKESRCLPSIIGHSLENDVADKEVDNVVQVGPALPGLSSPTLNGLNDKQQNQHHHTLNGAAVSQAVSDAPSESISRIPKPSASNPDDVDEKSKGPVVQQRGRFKVTSENVDLEKALPTPVLQKSHSMQVITQAPAISLPSPSGAAANPLGCSVFPQLHCILQTNILQRENILSLMKQVSTGDNSLGSCLSNTGSMSICTTISEKSLLEAAHEREKELLQEITDLQWRFKIAGFICFDG